MCLSRPNEEVACQRLKIGAFTGNWSTGYQAAFEAEGQGARAGSLAAAGRRKRFVGPTAGNEIKDVGAGPMRNPPQARPKASAACRTGAKLIRPAIAHFRLRKFYREGRNPNPRNQTPQHHEGDEYRARCRPTSAWYSAASPASHAIQYLFQRAHGLGLFLGRPCLAAQRLPSFANL